jgi:hypothetical protein
MSSRSWRAAACAALFFVSAGGALAADNRTQFSDSVYQISLVHYGNLLLANPRDKVALLETGLAWVGLGYLEPARVQLGRLKAVCGDCAEAAKLAEAIARPD